MPLLAPFFREPLADGANTTDALHRFPLSRNGGTLVHVSIRIGNQGPAFVGASIIQEGEEEQIEFLGDREWVRSTVPNEAIDVYSFFGRVPFKPQSLLKIFVRNDSGAELVWEARWLTE